MFGKDDLDVIGSSETAWRGEGEMERTMEWCGQRYTRIGGGTREREAGSEG